MRTEEEEEEREGRGWRVEEAMGQEESPVKINLLTHLKASRTGLLGLTECVCVCVWRLELNTVSVC